MRLKRRLWLASLSSVAISFLAVLASPAASLASDSTTIALNYESPGWSYQEVAYGADQGFQAPTFDASSWPVGQAGFGTTDGVCPWNNASQVSTPWDPGTDMLLRHGLSIPAGATNVHISGTVDNNADIYFNGDLIGQVQSGNCIAGAIDVDVPSTDIGSDNLLAIRATDLGDADYIDVQVSYDLPEQNPTITGITAPPITAATPLYSIPLQLQLSGGSCPSSVDVQLGSLPAVPEPVCGSGGSVPAILDVFIRPWDQTDTTQELQPLATVTASSGAAHTSVTLPAAPIWVGVGDSYSSGHHQDSSHWTCFDLTARCGVPGGGYDPGFAWETRATAIINSAFNVPADWQMTTDVTAQSGAATTAFAAGQVPRMTGDLKARSSSWNVVSVSGGADDGSFVFYNAIKAWYTYAILGGYVHQGVWAASAFRGPGCPDTQRVYATARAQRSGITKDLASVLAQAAQVSPAARLIDLYYPYVLPQADSCAENSILGGHGATAVVNMLDSAHDQVPATVSQQDPEAGPVIQLDLRDPASLFGSPADPRALLQLTAYYGYPHPTSAGQSDIAIMAVGALTGS